MPLQQIVPASGGAAAVLGHGQSHPWRGSISAPVPGRRLAVRVGGVLSDHLIAVFSS